MDSSRTFERKPSTCPSRRLIGHLGPTHQWPLGHSARALTQTYACHAFRVHARYLGRAIQGRGGLKHLFVADLALLCPASGGLSMLALQLDKGPELRALSLAMGYWWAKGRVRRAHGRREWCLRRWRGRRVAYVRARGVHMCTWEKGVIEVMSFVVVIKELPRKNKRKPVQPECTYAL